LFGGTPGISNVSLSNPHTGISSANAVISPTTLPVTVNGIVMLNSQMYKTPTTYQYSAGIQQQLGARSVLSAAYVGNVGRHESEATENDEPPYASLPGFFNTTTGSYNGLANGSRPYLGYGSLKIDQDDANSKYNSLQVSLRSQVHGLQMQAAYTYAHSWDVSNNNSNGGDGGDLDYVSNPYAGWRYDWGHSEYNRQQVAFVNFIYDIPLFRTTGSRFLKDTLGGWQVSGVVTMESGLPLNLGITGNSVCSAMSNCAIRPNLIGSIQYLKGSATTFNGVGTRSWVSPSAFALNILPGYTNVSTFGNLPNFGVWGPGRDNWNLALFKTFAAGERLHFELRVETFNAWNHPQINPAGIDTGVGDPNFGKATGNGSLLNAFQDPRVFQFAGKIVF